MHMRQPLIYDFLEIINFQIIELVCPRFCQLKVNAYDRIASTPVNRLSTLAWHVVGGVKRIFFQWFVISAFNEYN